MQAFGSLAGRTFDKIIIREDDNTRGRARGEIAETLRSAVESSGKDMADVQIVLDEMEAAQLAVETSQRGDLVVLLVDKPAAVWEQLTGRPPA